MRIYFIFLLVLVFACKKAEDRSCYKFNGEEVERTVFFEFVKKIYVGPYMDFVLIQDSLDYVKLTGGENVLNLVDIKVDEGKNTLDIVDKNKCRFLRSKKKSIQVEIHFTKLEEIFFEGSGRMTNVGKLMLPDVKIVLNEASGTVELNLESNKIHISAEPSWSNFILTGNTKILDMTVKGNAYADTRGLSVDSNLTVKSKSSCDIYVNASNTNYFKCETWNGGSIFYSGTPAWQDWNNYGTGKVVKND